MIGAEISNLDKDIDEYLPPDTLAWCHQTLQDANIDLNQLLTLHEAPTQGPRALQEGDDRPVHYVAYLHLREMAREHIRRGNTRPGLRESSKPTGNYDWIARNHAAATARRERQRAEEQGRIAERDLVFDGPEPGSGEDTDSGEGDEE